MNRRRYVIYIGIMLCMALSFVLFMRGGAVTRAEDRPTSINSSGGKNRDIAVDPTGKSEGFSAVLYDNKKGLPTSEANAIAETSEGFIWIGSYAGLIRYDGNTFERMDSTGGITSVTCLFVDSKDRLWIGTNANGVAVMEKGEYRIWDVHTEGLNSASIRTITEDGNGLIYVGSTEGIAIIDEDMNLRQIDDARLSYQYIQEMRAGNDGLVYGVTQKSDIFTLRNGETVSFLYNEDCSVKDVHALLPDPDNPGYLYLGTSGSQVYHGSIERNFEGSGVISVTPLTYVERFEYFNGQIWICAGDGIGNISGGRFYYLNNVPMNNSVGHVMTDYEGNLWFTSTRQGVMKVVKNQFSDVFELSGLQATVVNSTCMYKNQLFIATDSGLVVIKNGRKEHNIPIRKATTSYGVKIETANLIEYLDGVRIRSIVRDSKGRLWISTWQKQGLIRYDNGEIMVFGVKDGLFSERVRVVCELSDGSIAVANTGGVNIIEGDRITKKYGEESGIENTETLTMVEGYNGELILGSDGGGIYVISDSGTRHIGIDDGLSSEVIMRIKKDEARGLYWIVSTNSLAFMDRDFHVTTVEKFPFPNIFDVYENSHGDMWVMAGNGIYVTPVEDLLKNGELSPVFYNHENGLPCISTANSYCELTEEGDLYIAGTTGVVKVNIEETFEDVNDLKVAVPYIDVDGVKIYPDTTGTFTIPAEAKKVTVYSFVYNYSLINPQVSYQLSGFDSQSTTINRSDMVPVNYTNLLGGEYDFILSIKDAQGRGSSREASVHIIKEKKFYERTWFLIVLGVIAFLVLAVIVQLMVHLRTKKIERKQKEARDLFEQTAEALAGAIDAKDKYTNGHSRRVAEYSLRIAEEAGKSKDECEKVYFAALLHDVGKIGVPIEIISKKGRLTDEEFLQIKQHPVVGGEILSRIKKSPWLSLGARYHHEKYNGKGYPEGLEGENIPEIARIIAVADAYDAMTSNRSYRNAIPQHIVREELVKGIGTQFDPEFAKIMLHLIDLDTEYRMREIELGAGVQDSGVLRCETMYNDCTDGVIITRKPTRISLCYKSDDGYPEGENIPTLILFDSLDGGVHPGEEENKDLLYFEYARIRVDGQIIEEGIRKSETKVYDKITDLEQSSLGEAEGSRTIRAEAVRYKDHMVVRVSDEEKTKQITIALPDATRFAYIAIGGEHCDVHNIRVESSDEEIGPDTIPRIADEINYIKGCPVGDVPNIQVDTWRSEMTEGIKVEGEMKLSFHTKSLPTARLVWHCPFISVFSAQDGKYDSDDFREYILLRLDGENWESDELALNKVQISKKPSFEGWNVWKDTHKIGLDCVVTIKKEKNRVTMYTESLGVAVSSETVIKDETADVYVALTGDQVAITNIKIE